MNFSDEFTKEVFDVIIFCSLYGTILERADSDSREVYISVPKASYVGLAGDELAKMFKNEYINAVYKACSDVISREEVAKEITIYCRIRDEIWTKENYNEVKAQFDDIANKFKNSSFHVV